VRGSNEREREREKRKKSARIFFFFFFVSPVTTLISPHSSSGFFAFRGSFIFKKENRPMDGDLGAASAPATAPLDRDKAVALPPEVEVKGDDERAAQKHEVTTAMEEAEPNDVPEASAAPAPPSRNGGPFSSTVIPRTVDAIAEDHFKRRDAILRAITDGEKKTRGEDRGESMGAIVDFFLGPLFSPFASLASMVHCSVLLSLRFDHLKESTHVVSANS
jgi:hypothetical protein